MTWILALRGAAAVAVLLALVGGVPRIVQLGLAAGVGLWSAVAAGATPDGLGTDGAGTAALWWVAGRELVVGATLGLAAAIPLVAAATAGRLVAATGDARTRGPYRGLFGVLAAAVFVGVDGHVALLAGIARSFTEIPVAWAVAAGAADAGAAAAGNAAASVGGAASAAPRAVEALAALVPIAVTLAIPWLVAAAVVEVAAGVARRLAGQAGVHVPAEPASEAALAMMTASLLGTLAVAMAALVR